MSTTTSRLPTKDDLPKNVIADIVPSKDGKNTNAMILLHGLGDTKEGFTRLATNLSLPQTCALIPQAPTPIPALITGSEAPSFHWASDLEFSSTTGDIESNSDLSTSVETLKGIVQMLIGVCGYKRREIHFFGWRQGGMLALASVAHMESSEDVGGEGEFGSVISVGGRMSENTQIAEKGNGKGNAGRKKKTPVLVAGGNRKSEITREALEKVKKVFDEVAYVKWEREGDGMMRGREEVLPLMRFWGRRLRMGTPEGMEEI